MATINTRSLEGASLRTGLTAGPFPAAFWRLESLKKASVIALVAILLLVGKKASAATLAAPTPIFPKAGQTVTTAKITVTWSAPSTAKAFEVQIDGQVFGPYTSTSATPALTLSNGQHQLVLYDWDTNGTEGSSGAINFLVAIPAAAPATGVSTSNVATGTTASAPSPSPSTPVPASPAPAPSPTASAPTATQAAAPTSALNGGIRISPASGPAGTTVGLDLEGFNVVSAGTGIALSFHDVMGHSWSLQGTQFDTLPVHPGGLQTSPVSISVPSAASAGAGYFQVVAGGSTGTVTFTVTSSAVAAPVIATPAPEAPVATTPVGTAPTSSPITSTPAPAAGNSSSPLTLPANPFAGLLAFFGPGTPATQASLGPWFDRVTVIPSAMILPNSTAEANLAAYFKAVQNDQITAFTLQSFASQIDASYAYHVTVASQLPVSEGINILVYAFQGGTCASGFVDGGGLVECPILVFHVIDDLVPMVLSRLQALGVSSTSLKLTGSGSSIMITAAELATGNPVESLADHLDVMNTLLSGSMEAGQPWNSMSGVPEGIWQHVQTGTQVVDLLLTAVQAVAR